MVVKGGCSDFAFAPWEELFWWLFAAIIDCAGNFALELRLGGQRLVQDDLLFAVQHHRAVEVEPVHAAEAAASRVRNHCEGRQDLQVLFVGVLEFVRVRGRVPRTKSSRQMLAELELLYGSGFRGSLFLVDDNFIGNKRDALRLLLALRE